MKLNPLFVFVILAASVFASVFITSCATTSASAHNHIVTTKEGEAKFRIKEPLEQGASYSWSGDVDADGFATGRGTRTYYNADGAKVFEYDANFINGIDTAGPIEERQYDGTAFVCRRTGQTDISGYADGKNEWVYFNATDNEDTIRKYVHYRNGVRSGRTEVFSKDGSRDVEDYVDGKLDDKYLVYADGSIMRDAYFDGQKELKRRADEYRAQLTEEEAERRSSNNQAMLGALASGLSGLASDMNSSSSGGSSGYGSGSDSSGYSGGGYSGGGSSGAGRLTLKASGTAVSDTFHDSRGKSHKSTVPWGPNESYGSPSQGKAEADRKARELVRSYNEGYARQDREKAEESRRAAEKAEKERRYREMNPVPDYKGIIPK